MRRVLLSIGTVNKAGQETSQLDARSDSQIPRESWTGKNIGVRKPEPYETPLSLSEVSFGWKKGLL